jgi:hypothetical protein
LLLCPIKVRKTTIMKRLFTAHLLLIAFATTQAQDTLTRTEKVHHAEPLFFDLVRDLGARKGEKELNVGADFKHHKGYSENAYLVEYEFAPIDRLGLEIEADFSFYSKGTANITAPGNKLEALRLSSQYSFYVSTKYQTTLAVGYTQIFEFTDFKNYGKNDLVSATVYSPFFVAAKRWGKNWHSMVYTYPLIEQNFIQHSAEVNWAINTSFHYIVPNTGHFVGVEFNKEIEDRKFDMTIRPQIKVAVNDNLAVGVVTGIPIHKTNETISTFFRVIYEL